MTTFLQFHLLTAYPPSNPNRDDQGRPKEAHFGGTPRLRLSSQSIKRAVRESDIFCALAGHKGMRTIRIGRRLLEHLNPEADKRDVAVKVVEEIVQIFGKLDKEKSENEGYPVLATMTFVSPEEESKMLALAQEALKGHGLAKRAQLAEAILQKQDGAIDIAMFGRMLAGEKAEKGGGAGGKEKLDIRSFERDAAVQVGHAITTHKAVSDDDWFTAVDDLQRRDDNVGAGHINQHAFGSGVYYLYACVNTDLLVENLGGDRELARKGLEALARALATATPKGKQNSHAHHPRAAYVRAEIGPLAPRDLTGAFLKAVRDDDLLDGSIRALVDMNGRLSAAYGEPCERRKVLNITGVEPGLVGDEIAGSIDDIAAFAASAVAVDG